MLCRPSLILLASTLLTAPALAGDVDGGADRDAGSDPIVVIGKKDSYNARRTASATKTDTALQDVPQAITVVTAQQMSDQGMRTIGDVLRGVPGAAVASGEGHRDQILLRGQNTTADFFVDGLRDDVQYYRGLYNLERVEVLKGPNAMIFGRGGGGGIVNRVTKRAGGPAAAGASLALDGQGAWSAGLDVNQPLAGGLSGRVNAVRETFDSFRDHVDGHRIGINPTLGLELGDGDRVDVAYEYARDRRVVDRGIPSRDGRPLAGARTQFFGDEDVNRTRLDAHVVDLRTDVGLGSGLRWNGKARFGRYDKAYRNALAATAVRADGTVGIEAYRSGSTRRSWFVQNDIVASLITGGIDHRLVVGVDAGWQDGRSDRQQGFFDNNGGVRTLYVPLGVSDDLPAITFRDDPARRASDGKSDAAAYGVYVQDQVELGQHVQLIGGLRRDWFRLDYHDLVGGNRLSRKDSTWSPRLGLVIKPAPALSLYASWSKSFLPQSGDQFSSLNADTSSLAPEKFINREIGAKWAVTPDIDATIAAYLLDRTNTRATDPVTNETVLSGEQRSKGIEASLTGRVLPNLSVVLGAALQRARIRQDTASAPAGTSVPGVPRVQLSAWGRYDLSKRLGFGLGATHVGARYASTSNAVKANAYTRLDAAAYLALSGKIELQVNVENLTDAYYIAATHNDNNLTPGAGRTVRAALRFGL